MQDNPNYSYISTIITSDEETHYIKDAEARNAISSLETSKQDKITSDNKIPASNVSGLATVATSGSYDDLSNKPYIPEGAVVDTAMSDSSTNSVQNKVIKQYVDNQISGLGAVLNYKGTKTSESEIKAITSAKVGDVWVNTADNSEWVCKQTITTATASAWEKLGPTIDLSGYELKSNLKALAYKDSASGNFTPSGSVTLNDYTPEGSVSMDNFTPAGNLSMNNFTPSGTIGTGSGTANYTPAGTVSTPTINVTPSTDVVNSITNVGTLPSLEMSVENETLTLSFNAGTLPTKGQNQTVVTGIQSAISSQPTFTGTGAELTFTGTPAKPSGSFVGTAAKPTGTFSGTAKAPTGSFAGTQGSVTVS